MEADLAKPISSVKNPQKVARKAATTKPGTSHAVSAGVKWNLSEGSSPKWKKTGSPVTTKSFNDDYPETSISQV